MRFRARVEVRLKPGFFDPEGETAKEALNDLGFSVDGVRVSKVYEIDLEAESGDAARVLAEEMCRKLLANPVKDVYSIEVRKA